MADILAHLHVDENTLAAAMLYRGVREGVIPLAKYKSILANKCMHWSKALGYG